MAEDIDRSQVVASGVDSLIERLRSEGVHRGHHEAERIVEQAEARAKKIVQEAHEKGERIREAAEGDAARSRRAAEEALGVAVRDALIRLKRELGNRFAMEVRRLTLREMQGEDLLKQMILEVTRRARDEIGRAEGPMEVLLPRDAVGLEDLRRDPEDLENGPLTRFVRSVAQDLAERGIQISPSDQIDSGLQVVVREGDITLDLSDEAVADVLLQHLQPRFRALVEGIIK
jgi:V/A-type H+-transporting ATPase subunit E